MTDKQYISPLLMDAMRSTHEYTLAPQLAELERYRAVLAGIASCATQCACCRLHVGIARDALDQR